MSVSRKPPRTPLAELALLRREIDQLFERLAAWNAVDEPAPDNASLSNDAAWRHATPDSHGGSRCAMSWYRGIG